MDVHVQNRVGVAKKVAHCELFGCVSTGLLNQVRVKSDGSKSVLDNKATDKGELVRNVVASADFVGEVSEDEFTLLSAYLFVLAAEKADFYIVYFDLGDNSTRSFEFLRSNRRSVIVGHARS